MFNKQTFYLNLGKNIKKIRTDAEFTLEELIEKSDLDIGKSSLSEIENGKQKILPHQLYLISKTLSTPIDSIIEEAGIASSDITNPLTKADQNRINQV